MNIILYSRPQCTLCNEAKDKLDLICETLDLIYKEIDIYTDDALLEKYQLMIPVVEVDGEVVMVGKCTYSSLKKSIQNKLEE